MFAPGTGFILERNPDTVRAPDAAFLTAERAANLPKRGFYPGPPDLAVEVLSPDDTASEVLDKVAPVAARRHEVGVDHRPAASNADRFARE